MAEQEQVRPSGPGAVLERAAPVVVGVAIAFAIAGVFIALMGFDVSAAYRTIVVTSFRTPNGFAETLHKFVPLTLQAFAFTIPLAAGKFNIGGEGQLLMGAIATTAVGITLAALPPLLLVPLALLAGAAAGALWAAIAAWLLHRFGVNEILTTVLLNFVSFGFVTYVATEVWEDAAAGHPTTIPIAVGARLPLMIARPPLHSGLVIALSMAVLVAIYTARSAGGYALRATGANQRAAFVHGIPVRRVVFAALAVGGAMGGLSGAIETAGVHHRLIEGMQSNYLLLGIIIGLIARGNNVAVPFVAFLIAVLEVGASALQRTIGIPAETVLIIEALVLLFVLLSDVVRARLRFGGWTMGARDSV